MNANAGLNATKHRAQDRLSFESCREVSAMTRNKPLLRLVILLAAGSRLCAAQAATPAPSFTISASNVTMPASGSVPIPFTLTSVNGYAGIIAVNCTAPTEAAGVKIPVSYQGGPVMAYPLTAGGTATGSITLLANIPKVIPLVRSSNLASGTGATGALAGMLLLGLGLRRKGAFHSARLLPAIVLLIGLASIGLCGCGGQPTLTPGTYVFTLNATSVSNGTQIPQLTATTTATVTVPAGIVTTQ